MISLKAAREYNHLTLLVIRSAKYGASFWISDDKASNKEVLLDYYPHLRDSLRGAVPKGANSRARGHITEPRQLGEHPASWADNRGVGSFFIHPRLGLEIKRISIERTPDIIDKPTRGEVKQRGFIEAKVRIVNRSNWAHFLLPTIRAEDCKAELLLFEKGTSRENASVFHEDCYWHEGERSIDIPASFYPKLLTIFFIDPNSHDVLHLDSETNEFTGTGVVPPGQYELGLILDAKGTSATEISLGVHNFPSDFISDASYRTTWKRILKDGGYAVFFERDSQGALFANVVGEMPTERKATLRKELKSGVTIREV